MVRELFLQIDALYFFLFNYDVRAGGRDRGYWDDSTLAPKKGDDVWRVVKNCPEMRVVIDGRPLHYYFKEAYYY